MIWVPCPTASRRRGILVPCKVFCKLIDMNKISTFVKESYQELMEKVTWPKWDQLQQSTMIVLGATLFITAIVALMDFIANGSMKFIYSLFE